MPPHSTQCLVSSPSATSPFAICAANCFCTVQKVTQPHTNGRGAHQLYSSYPKPSIYCLSAVHTQEITPSILQHIIPLPGKIHKSSILAWCCCKQYTTGTSLSLQSVLHIIARHMHYLSAKRYPAVKSGGSCCFTRLTMVLSPAAAASQLVALLIITIMYSTHTTSRQHLICLLTLPLRTTQQPA